jgi:uncharacterized protein with gpF-like domain
MTKNQILKNKIDESIRALRNNEKATVKGLISELSKTREDINRIVRGTERFEGAYYRSLLRSINEKINEYKNKMTKTVTSSQETAFKYGENLVPGVMKSVGYNYAFGRLSDELIVTAKNISVDYISGMTTSMRDDIARTIRQGLLKGENNYDVARQIDGIIGTSKKFGYLNRADIIARTEIGRAYSIARQAQDEASVKILPGLKKQWKSGFNPRNKDMGGGRGFISHSEPDGQIRNVDEPFDVGGEQMMAPRMGEKAENNVNCNCQSVPYMEEWPE